MNRFNSLKILILIGVVFMVSSCNSGNNQALENKKAEILPPDIVELRDDQIKIAGIQLGAVEMRSMSNSQKVSGVISVAPQNQATVCMPLGGFIKNITLMPGDAVFKGQTLAIIENQEFVDIQQNYLETKNKLVFAEAEFKRHSDLFEEDVYSKQNVQQVTVDYRNLKALMKSLEQKLLIVGIDPTQLTEDNISSTVNLPSPIRGFLKAVNVNVGKYVTATDVLFEIVNSDKLFLELSLFEKDADKMNSGQKVKFFVNSEEEEHEAVIFQTGKTVSDDKTFKVYAGVNTLCKNLLPGMYVNAWVVLSEDTVTALPSESIVSFDDKSYIFCYEKEKVEEDKPFTEYKMIEVKKGISASGYTGIVLPDGFNIGIKKVVIKGAYNLLSAKKNAGEMAC